MRQVRTLNAFPQIERMTSPLQATDDHFIVYYVYYIHIYFMF